MYFSKHFKNIKKLFISYFFQSAWIVKIVDHAEMLREQNQLESTDEEADEKHSFVVSQKGKSKSKAPLKAQPMKKKKKNDGLLPVQESQLLEEYSSDSD